MSTKKWKRTLLDEARGVANKFGVACEISLEERNSGHLRIVFQSGDRRKTVDMSRTPRCPFAMRHVQGDFRRVVRELGGA